MVRIDGWLTGSCVETAASRSGGIGNPCAGQRSRCVRGFDVTLCRCMRVCLRVCVPAGVRAYVCASLCLSCAAAVRVRAFGLCSIPARISCCAA